MKIKVIFGLLQVSLLLTGCGLKGDLYLPEDKENTTQSDTAATNSPEPDTETDDQKTKEEN